MTSMKMRDPKTDELLTPHNAVLIIIDVQPVQVASLATMGKRALVQNVKSLAEIAKLYKLPTILSTVNVQTGLNKPMIQSDGRAERCSGVRPNDTQRLGRQRVPRSRQSDRSKKAGHQRLVDGGVSGVPDVGCVA
jgi:nicotinamidase-related amidase